MAIELKITNNSNLVREELNARIPIVLEALGIEAEGNAISEVNDLVYSAPESPSYVRTGRLKGSITHEVGNKEVLIGSNVEYAPWVEFGTSRMAPRPFLQNAIDNYVDDYKRIVKDGLGE